MEVPGDVTCVSHVHSMLPYVDRSEQRDSAQGDVTGSGSGQATPSGIRCAPASPARGTSTPAQGAHAGRRSGTAAQDSTSGRARRSRPNTSNGPGSGHSDAANPLNPPLTHSLTVMPPNLRSPSGGHIAALGYFAGVHRVIDVDSVMGSDTSVTILSGLSKADTKDISQNVLHEGVHRSRLPPGHAVGREAHIANRAGSCQHGASPSQIMLRCRAGLLALEMSVKPRNFRFTALLAIFLAFAFRPSRPPGQRGIASRRAAGATAGCHRRHALRRHLPAGC